MMLRQRLPDGTCRDIDLGPCCWVPIHGHTHRFHAITGGRIARPAATPEATDHRREQVRAAVARYRARRVEA